MTGQHIKKYQKKNAAWGVLKTNKKTRNYISSLPAAREKLRKYYWTRKYELIIDFQRKNETKNNKTSILWL